jgi:hypothetical protein
MMSSRERRHEGDQHDAHHDPGGHDARRRAAEAQGLREVVAQERAHRDQREQAVDDGRDAREDLDQRFGDGAHALGGVFGHVDGGEEPDGNRDK